VTWENCKPKQSMRPWDFDAKGTTRPPFVLGGYKSFEGHQGCKAHVYSSRFESMGTSSALTLT